MKIKKLNESNNVYYVTVYEEVSTSGPEEGGYTNFGWEAIHSKKFNSKDNARKYLNDFVDGAEVIYNSGDTMEIKDEWGDTYKIRVESEDERGSSNAPAKTWAEAEMDVKFDKPFFDDEGKRLPEDPAKTKAREEEKKALENEYLDRINSIETVDDAITLLSDIKYDKFDIMNKHRDKIYDKVMEIRKDTTNESLDGGIEVATIADYITDHYKFETIDDKYSCIDSIKDSFKDGTISKEELEQFIGSHNGKDKMTESLHVDEISDYLEDYFIFDSVDDKYDCVDDIVHNYDKLREVSKEEFRPFVLKHNGKDKVNEGIDGWDNRTGVIKRIDKYLYDNPEAAPPKGYINKHSRAYDDAVIRYGDYVTTPFGNISTDDLMKYARDNKLLDESMKDYRFEVSCNDGPTKVVKLIWDEKDIEGAKEMAKKYYAQEHTTYADDRYNKWIIEESLNEALSPKEGDRVQMDFYAKDNNGATGTCTGRIGELCFIEWDDGTKSKEIKGYLKVIERPSMNEASYGGAFDIADDQIFTREDIDDLAEEVLNHINETYEYKFDISAAYIDGNELEVGVENDELGEYTTTLKIDMRKVKEPWHLKRVYAFEVASDLINQISTSLNNLGESLTESATEGAKPIETGAAVGMATILSDLIKDEYEAIDGYNTAIATAEAEGFGDMVKVLTDIQAEENIHIGQLQELMKMVDPNASKIEDGTVEAKELLSNPSVNNDDDFDFEGIDENFDVSEDDIADEDVDSVIKAVEEAMKKPNEEEIDIINANFDLEDDDGAIVESTEPWEDIYNSFKDIEVQLNGDGEAITATIDRIYNDNKGNPDFEKAYKKWAANE